MSQPSPEFDTLERLVPDEASDQVSRETLELHLERYRFAAKHCEGGRVLDIACGVGYGSRCLGDLRGDISVLGVDRSAAAIRYATSHYAGPSVSFAQDDAMTFQSDTPFDTVVSLETIEHLPDPEGFIDHVVQMIRGGGTFVASVPTTPSVDANPHHLHDFTKRKLCNLVERHGFSEIDELRQVQPFGLWSVLAREDARAKNTRPNLASYYLHHPGSFARRVMSTLRHGFNNRYVTVAWRAAAQNDRSPA